MEMPEKSQETQEVSNQDLTLNENRPATTEPAPQPTDAEDVKEPVADEKPETHDAVRRHPAFTTTAEVVDALEALAGKDADEIGREEVSFLKQQFYSLERAANDELKKAFVEAGNAPEAYEAKPDENEEKFKQILDSIKSRKAARAAEIEARHQRNYELKENLINEILAMASDTDNVNRQFPRFREIQQEFKAVGDVAPQFTSDQWKKYQDAVEHFYDQLKVNKDLRDYDFKKNQDTKLHLCEEAEALAAEPDVIVAFKRLQDLHVKWRETGPVAKEIREEIWARFKDASAVVNKKYQAYFEERKQKEQQNEEAKKAICERVEAIDIDALKSFNAWNEQTKVILQAQDDWKKLGFASKKTNNALFSRFRETCDRFFARKGEYYRAVKDDLAANYARKVELCEKAEALKDSTDWKATADKFAQLQKEWKTIGAVSKKQSDAIWKRFQTACDHFFDQKKKDLSDSRRAENANLKAKKALTAGLKAIAPDAKREDVIAAIRDAQARWSEIGHVPFREKDKIYEDFRETINGLYKTHDLRENKANFARFESSISEISDESKLYRERERLTRALEQRRGELTTYQNNIGFFNIKSASGSSMLRDAERRTQRIKEDIADLEKKIKLIDERL